MLTVHIYPSVSTQCTHTAEKSVQVIGKKSGETAICTGIVGRNSLLFQWSQVSRGIPTAKGQHQLFAEAHLICSIRQWFEPSAQPNN